MTNSIISAKKTIKYVSVIAFWVVLWQVIALIVNQPLLIPAPVSVIVAMGKMVVTQGFWITLAMTVLRVVIGFIVGMLVGAVMALTAFRFKWFNALIAPLIYIVQSTPVASFIILALAWLGTSTVPTFICTLMVIPVIFSNLLAGLNSVDKDLLEMADVFKLSFFKKLINIYIPSLSSYIMSAAATGLGLGWKAGIAAEVICRSKNSIGNNIYESKFYLLITEMFAWTFVVILLSVLFDKILKLLYKKFSVKYVEV